MARVRWQGTEFYADPVPPLLPNGNWLMTAKQHGPRVVPGTEIVVRQSEIIEMAAAETPQTAAESLAVVERAMAEERKTLPTPAELIAKAPKTVPTTSEGG